MEDRGAFLLRIIDLFISFRVVLGLFGLLVLFLVPSTMVPEFTTALLYPVKGILVLLSLNLLLCTWSKWKRLKLSTLVIHMGSLTILIGGLISSFGFVATVNIYEGTATDTVFNWKLDQEVPLDFNLRVARVNTAYHPADVKIGILKNGKKAELVVTRTGKTFLLEGYRVRVLALNPQTAEVELALETADGERVGSMSTGGAKDLPPAFPLDFQLVAFKDPAIKRMWADLELLRNGEVLASGTSEVNIPFRWQGMQFVLTQYATDHMGRGYAGIQISRDPGIPYVYGGFVILFLGLLFSLKSWLAGVRAQETVGHNRSVAVD